MKILIFFIFMASSSGEIFTMRTRALGSVRERLIRTGRYDEFLRIHNGRRSQLTKSHSQILRDYYDNAYIGEIQIGTPG
ncbi:hypothetical protein Q1695_004667 [Nippostrongylus brasiliensis]|nr:hypothetical protein Q1695_004667 [Nippostrongylus brasiliensis]